MGQRSRENSAIEQNEKGPPKARRRRADNGIDTEPGELTEECRMVRIAQAILQLRRQRKDEFDESLFGEPAWEMLLELYVRDASGTVSTVAELLANSDASDSTAVRWLFHLDKLGFVTRRAHPLDAKTEFVDLTVEVKAALERHLATALKLVV